MLGKLWKLKKQRIESFYPHSRINGIHWKVIDVGNQNVSVYSSKILLSVKCKVVFCTCILKGYYYLWQGDKNI